LLLLLPQHWQQLGILPNGTAASPYASKLSSLLLVLLLLLLNFVRPLFLSVLLCSPAETPVTAALQLAVAAGTSAVQSTVEHPLHVTYALLHTAAAYDPALLF
jgi:hypothetical protein